MRADPLAAIAAHGLRGSRLQLTQDVPSDSQFTGLLPRLIGHRLVGLAASAADSGAWRLTERQMMALRGAHADAMCACLHLEATLLDVNGSLHDRSIPVRVVKGPASAHLDYAQPELRHFGDLDLLVRTEDVDQAKETLSALGFSRSSPEPRPGFDRRFGKGATFVAADGTNVDLHRTFVMGPLGLRVQLDDLWADSEAFSLGGEAVLGLSPTHRLLAACYNAVVGDSQPRMSTLRDIAELSLRKDLPVPDVIETAGRWGADLVLARGVALAWRTFDLADVVGLSAWATRYPVDAESQRLLALYHDRSAGYSGLSWATARMLPPNERVAFMAALAFPRGGRLGKRGWGLGQRLQRAARGYSRPHP